MNQVIYTFNMLPINDPDRGSDWRPLDAGEYISRMGRSRFDYAVKNIWFTFNEFVDMRED